MSRTFVVLVLSFFCAFASLCPGGASARANRAASQNTPVLVSGHPCCLWDTQDIAAYRADMHADPKLAVAFHALKVWGNQRVTQPLGVPAHQMGADGSWSFPAYKRGYKDASGQWVWQWDFNTRLQQCSDDVSNLGVLYALTGDKKYAALAQKILLALTDAYGYGNGSSVPDPNGYDHFAAYGFDGGDDGLFLAKVCNGYDLIYNSVSAATRTRIGDNLIHPIADHLKTFTYMYTNHGRWALVCLYGLLISGATLNDQSLVNLALYGPGGTADKVTGGFMDCFQPSVMNNGVIWGAEKQIPDQMAAVCIMTTAAQVMWHRGVDLYDYQDRTLKRSFDAALASTSNGDFSSLLALPGVDSFEYAYHRYHDTRYLPVIDKLTPGFDLNLGVTMPSLPASELSVPKDQSSGVPQSRLDKLSRGVDVTQWFQVYSAVPASHYSDYMSDKEMALISNLGLTNVRLCVSPDYLYDPKNPATISDARLALLETAIRRFNQHNLAVVVDLHNTQKQGTEDNPQWVAGYPVFWGALAAKLSNLNPGMVYFEILNEPVFTDHVPEWYRLQDKCIAAIRKSAPQFTIVATGANWSSTYGLAQLEPVADPDVVYTFHFYDPMTFTHQGATWAGPPYNLLKGIPYPSSPEAVAAPLAQLTDPAARKMVQDYGAQHWDRAKLQSTLAQALDWGRDNHVALYCGEFGVYPIVAPPDFRARWFRDFGSLLQQSHVGWALWGWDDGFGFGRTYVNGKIVINTVPVGALGLNENALPAAQ